MRVSELRENVGTISPELATSLAARFVPIAKLNALVIAPSWLELRVVNPTTQYIRLFEGRAWEPYLGRAADLRRSDKLLVYHWKHGPIAPDGTTPFRGFMALATEARWPGWFSPAATALTAALLVASAVPVQTFLPTLTLPQLTAAAFLTLAAAFADRVRNNFSVLASLPSAARRLLLDLEDAAYRRGRE